MTVIRLIFKKRCKSLKENLAHISRISRVPGTAAFAGVIFLIVASIISVTAIHFSAITNRPENAFSAISASFSEIEDQGLDVIAAFKDRRGALVVREFGGLRKDGVAPEETLVDLGSITKTVTAVATLKLVEQGKLDLDETLDSIWPDAPDDKASITVHELLTHTSGLPDGVGNDKERLSREEFVDRVMDIDIDEDAKGEYRYSNAGYGLLAAIIELRSGKPFEIFLNEDVLAPAGLEPIGYESVYDDRRSLLSPRAWPTLFQRQPISEASWGGRSPGWNLVGNGGLVATPAAYLRFWSAVREGRVIDRALLRKALAPHADGLAQEESFYGYGVMVQEVPGYGRIYWHDGENDLFSSEWRELGPNGLQVFTAGRGRDAFAAMRLILRRLGLPAVG